MNNQLLKLSLRFAALIALIIGTAYLNAAFAQTTNAESQVNKIRGKYAETNTRINAGLKDRTAGYHHAGITVGGERDGQQWSAVGTMSDRTDFYFECEPENIEECDGETNVRNLIVKITTEYRGAADLHSNAEYLFDKGELIFAFTKSDVASEDGKMIETRFYFAKGKLIRLVRDGKTADRNFSADDQTEAKDALDQAKHKQNIFALMFAEN